MPSITSEVIELRRPAVIFHVTGDDHERLRSLPARRRRAVAVVAQPRNLAPGAQPEHAGTAGSRHGPVRVRAGAGLREQLPESNVPEAPDAPSPRAAPSGTVI